MTGERLSEDHKRRLAAEAVDWIAEVALRRRPIEHVWLETGETRRERLIEMEVSQHKLKFQGVALVVALDQIYQFVRHFEHEEMPEEATGPLARFLDAMRTGRLLHLRDALLHYGEFLAGKTSAEQLAKKADSWDQHQARSFGEQGVFFKAATKESYESMMQGIGANIDDGGVTAVLLLGRGYDLMDAFRCALELGPPLSKLAGRTLLKPDDLER